MFYERFRPRKGHWELYGNVRYAAEGLGGVDEGADVSSTCEPTYHVNDALSFFTGCRPRTTPTGCCGAAATCSARSTSNMLSLNAGITWLIDDKQELRVRLEAIGLDAHALQAWRVAADGTPVASDEEIADFGLRNLGFQIRYRYELAPLSYLYVAYVRGGSLFEEGFGRVRRARAVQRCLRPARQRAVAGQAVVPLRDLICSRSAARVSSVATMPAGSRSRTSPRARCDAPARARRDRG